MTTDPKKTEDDDSLYGPERDTEDAEMRSIIETALKNTEGTEEPDDDAGGFGAPIEQAREQKTVSHEQGLDLIDKGKFAARARPEAQPASEDADPEADAGQAKTDAKPESDAAPVADKPMSADDDLLADLPEDRRAAISERLGAAARVMDIFKGHEAELERHNATPEDAMKRLVYLNGFAQEKPDEYIAWVAGEMNPDAAHEVLNAAAKHLGYKVVRDAPEGEDEFEDEEIRKLREENARLKAGNARTFGPDAPERVAQRTVADQITAFETETDAAGNLRRPYFGILRAEISAEASAMRGRTGKPVTIDQLDEIYRTVEAKALKAFGVTSAAQTAADVTSQGQQTKKAADIAKAKAASTSIDGSGQGADRQPALSPDASIADVVRHYAGKMIG